MTKRARKQSWDKYERAFDVFNYMVECANKPSIITIQMFIREWALDVYLEGKDEEEVDTESREYQAIISNLTRKHGYFKRLQKDDNILEPTVPLAGVYKAELKSLGFKNPAKMTSYELMNVLNDMTGEVCTKWLATSKKTAAVLILESDYEPPIQKKWREIRGAAAKGVVDKEIRDRMKASSTFARLDKYKRLSKLLISD